MKFRLAFSKLAFLILFACAKDETVDRGYPKLTTLEVTDITVDGAQFNADVDYPDLSVIVEHGFVWSRTKPLSLESSEFFKSGKIENNKFNKRIQSTLEADITYYVRSYVKTSKKIIYGDIVEFRSLGSHGPQISRVTPGSGRIGDSVVIHGKNFSSKNGENKVMFNQTAAEILKTTDSTLTAKVPSVSVKSVKVKVAVLNNNSNELDFTNISHSIDQILPANPLFCDTLTILGDNFIPDKSKIDLKLNDEGITIISASETKIRFLLPHTFDDSIAMKLSMQGVSVVKHIAIKVTAPEVSSISDNVLPTDTVIIRGKNFPTCDILKASSQYSTFKVIKNTSEEIRVVLNDQNCIQAPLKITITTQNRFSSFTTPPIGIKTFKLYSISPDTATFGESIIATGEDFEAISSYSARLMYIGAYGYNMETELPIKSGDKNNLKLLIPDEYAPPRGTAADVSIRSCRNEIILHGAFKLKQPVITDFTPTTITDANQVLTITGANFNPNLSLDSVFFSDQKIRANLISATANEIKVSFPDLINNVNISQIGSVRINAKAGGRTGTSSGSLIFDIPRALTQKSDFPGGYRESGISFSIGSKGYIGLGQSDYNKFFNDLWEYDPSTDAWKKLADFPGAPRRTASCVVLNGKAYVGMGADLGNQYKDWWEYDPTMDKWTRKSDIPGIERNSALSFAINNKGYLGAGDNWTTASPSDFYEYDPQADSWVQKANAPWNIGVSFEFNGKGYVYGSYTQQEYSYDPISDAWSSSPTSIALANGWVVLRYDTYFIAVNGGYTFKLNPIQNLWQRLPDASFYRISQTGFVINNVGYLALGRFNDTLGQWHFFNELWSVEPDLLK